jgi:phospholipid/cholesterol/gamma-HCH transport system permease protein
MRSDPSTDSVAARSWALDLDRPAEGELVLRLSGHWRLQDKPPAGADIATEIAAGPPVRRLRFDTTGVTSWDTSLLTFAGRVLDESEAAGIEVDRSGLPEGARRLLALAAAVPERRGSGGPSRPSWLARIGLASQHAAGGAVAMLGFIGSAVLALAAFIRGRARFQVGDLFLVIQECGPRALPIVSLISFLVGIILAFVGAVQLRQFGAQIYVADLVAIAMATEMGAMMTGIIMAGRTGAAFAAQLGTMQVNEEIDALVTMGISPMEFLVLPRMLALVLMVPLLTLYADLLGILGGTVVAATMLDVDSTQYINETIAALTAMDFVKGLVKGSVFGVLVAIAGCLRGLECGRSSAAVGLAATSAVVTAIVFIIVADALLTIIYNVLGI